ncbi:MAG: GNAT family N-acetyltransferase [Elusimicrobia bacterium]|nr:GNAT family N-acetyltransferase [Elusimicrobiota bacterium]
MKDFAVRPAAAADAAAVGALAKSRPFTAKWPIADLSDEASRPDALFFVAVDGPIRGYALARLVDKEVRLLDLAAAEDGRGLGRALWDALLDAARERGAAKLTLEVSADNARAAAFYAKRGAKVVGRRPKFYYDGSDAVLMDLEL